MKKALKIIGITLGVLLVVILIFAKANHISPISMGFHYEINQTDGFALKGNDVVSYFENERPLKGEEAFSFDWKGAKWLFSSEENKSKFEANPEQYAPQYGGYCSFAVSTGFTADCESNTFKIMNGKLYLFSAPEPMQEFIKDSSMTKSANKNWKQ